MDAVKVVLLRKNLSDLEVYEKKQYTPTEESHWVALGDYDDIIIYPLDDNNGLLSSIQEDRRKVFMYDNDKYHHHPLYLVSDSKEKVYKYTNFIAIVRIHFSKSLSLISQFNNLTKVMANEFGTKELSYNVYYATEFSDVVLDIRSNNFNYLINAVLSFRKNKKVNIGKMYTYFGINIDLLKKDNAIFDSNDIIPFVSIRFSGYNMALTNKQISVIKSLVSLSVSGQYLINGVYDAVLLYRNLPTSELVKLYGAILIEDKYKKYPKYESITIAGIEFNVENTYYPNSCCDNELIESHICKDLPILCKKIAGLINNQSETIDYGWFHTIYELAHSLVRMCQNPIMDEVVYLVAPAIRAFLINILKLIENEPSWYHLNYSYYYDYVESCSYFVEQLTRIEGQLSNQPEIRPVIHDIPVFMIEYAIAFLNKVSCVLQKDDGAKKVLNTVFLLVPRPCKHMQATELFSATDQVPGLVHLQIPEGALYSPQKIFVELCHEISHYVGEKYRQRDLRKKWYAYASASLVATNIFESANKNLILALQNLLEKSLNNLSIDSTIREMHNNVKNAVLEKVSTPDEIIEVFREYYKYCQIHNKEALPLSMHIHAFPGLDEYIALLPYVDTLFREVFADICMLHILDVDINQYIEVLMDEYAFPNNNISCEVLIIRIFVCLKVMDKTLENRGDFDENKWRALKYEVDVLQKRMNEDECSDIKAHIPDGVIKGLYEYAKSCYDTIKKSLTPKDIEPLLSMYDFLSSDKLHYHKLLKEIEKCRKNMLST